MRALAIYTRLSFDHGAQTATARQEESCRALALARDWPVSGVYEDVDVSAYQPKVVRPRFEQLLSDVEAGTVDGVVVWKLDRLVRKPSDFERLWSVLERRRAILVSVTEPVDTSSDLGLAIVRILVTFASLESATIGMRLKARWQQDARAGRPPSSNRAYGYTRGFTAIVPEQAAVLREAAERVLAGQSIRSVVLDFNNRGIPAPAGRARGWDHSVLRSFLAHPRYSGQRVYKGEVVATHCWEPILSEEDTERLRLVLMDPRRRPARPGREYVLSGFGVCGLCGFRLVGTFHHDGVRAYRCPNPPAACGRVQARAHHLEPLVLAGITARASVETPQPRERTPEERIADNFALAERFAALRRIAREHYVEHTLDTPAFHAARFELEHAANLVEHRALREGLSIEEVRRRLAGWDSLSLQARRVVIRAFLSQFVLKRAKPGNRFDPERVDLRWHDHDLVEVR